MRKFVFTGLLLAVFLTRILASLLFGIGPFDPMTFAGTSVLLTAVGAAACTLPALRALRQNPIEALRYE